MGIPFLLFLAAVDAIVVFVIALPSRPPASLELGRPEEGRAPKVSFGS
jgi:hypothetical protein